MLCIVLRSHKKADTYLYKAKDTPFEELPETLQQLFTPHTQVMTLPLKGHRKLARLTVEELKQHIDSEGFYLQLPATTEDLLKAHKAQHPTPEENPE